MSDDGILRAILIEVTIAVLVQIILFLLTLLSTWVKRNILGLSVGLFIGAVATIATVAAMGTIWGIFAFLCHSCPRSLLPAPVEPHGTMQKDCQPGVKSGGKISLTLAIQNRTGNHALCCVVHDPPVDIKPDDEILVDIVLQEPEQAFEARVEFEDYGLHLHPQGPITPGPRVLKKTINKRDLRWRPSDQIVKFCIGVVGDGPLQTVTVNRAVVFSPKRPLN